MELPAAWAALLRPDPAAFAALSARVEAAYAAETVYPPRAQLFAALETTPPQAVRCVILGQDPYHEPGQAHGLCFSVKEGTKLPPSLVNIYKELYSDLGIEPSESGDLTAWAKQGVLLLNTTLTVRRGVANSHSKCGWTEFTDEVIKKISEREKPVVFILWGGNARAKKSLIDLSRHFVIESAHPSPLSCYNGFFGSKPFSRTNEYLKSIGETPIDWRL